MTVSDKTVSFEPVAGGKATTTGPPATLTLRLQFEPRFQVNKHSGYRIRVEVASADNMPTKIFRYYRYPEISVGGPEVDEFTGVCSYVDLIEVPEDKPRDGDSPKVYRLDYFDIIVDTESLAYEAWQITQEEVSQLVQSVNQARTLLEAVPVSF